MSIEKQIELERNEMAEIIAKESHYQDDKWDASDYEWAAHCLQVAGYHKKREGGKYIRLEDLQQFPIRKNHYDKEHGSEHFIFGVESVIEYAEHLPTYDVPPESVWISVEEMDLAVLSCYRNKYYTDGNSTEQGIIANAINNILPILVSLKNGDYRKQSEGEWIAHEDDWCGAFYTCSVCKCDWTTIDGTPQENNMRYCPECGAKMKGE